MKRIALILVSLFVIASMALAGCQPAVETEEMVEETEEMVEETEEMVEETEQSLGTIVDIAVADGRFTTLVTALQAADLVGTLSSDGPFTVFAPTDDAFAKLPEGTVEALLEDIPALTDILLYHVVSGKVLAEDVVKLEEAETASGEKVMIKVEDGKVFINDAEVVITDIMADNGVIHVVDTVLLPPEEEGAALGTEENPLIWALVPSGETEDVLAGFDSVTDLLYEETGLVIEAFVATEYVGVIEALAADPPKAHIASLATFAYLVAAERGVAEAELVAVRYGAPYYTGQIFVRTDSGITDIAELGGMTFCRPDEYSTSGWIIPSITLQAAGVDLDSMNLVDAGSHDASVVGVYNGDCDAGSSFVDARSSVSDEYPDVMEVLTVINESVEIPNDGVQYHPSVSREIRDLINGVLLRIDEIEGAVEALEQAYEWTELAAFGDDFYDPFRNVLSAAGVNIEDYLGE